MSSSSKPTNHGSAWSEQMEAELVYRLQLKKSIEDCATYFQRTRGGIRSRQRHIARKLVAGGVPINEVSDLVKLDVADIEQSILASKRSKEIIQKKKKIEITEETPLSVLKEIRDLMKQVVINTKKV